METVFIRIGLLILPLIVGGILLMIAVKRDILSYLKKPIHQRWFGQNKTWRGFVLMPIATWLGVVMTQAAEVMINMPLLLARPSWQIAIVLGLGYCLAELPNSFIKRRLGIKAGQTSEKFKWFFVIIDQGDSAIGCMLAYKLLFPLDWSLVWLSALIGTVLHLVINVLLYKLKIRKNPS